MKVALLFYGQARHIDNIFVYNSFKENIINKYDADVFCHTWWSEDTIQYEPGPRCCNNEVFNVKENLMEELKTKYNPVILKSDKQIDFYKVPLGKKYIDMMMSHDKWGTQGFKWDSIEGRKPHNFFVVLSCLYSMEKVTRELETYCKANNKEYDFVFISRYDNYIKHIPDLKTLSKDKFYVSDIHPYWPDFMFLCGAKLIDSFKIFSYLMSQMENNAEEFMNKLDRNMGEHVKELAFYNSYSREQLEAIPLMSSIVRGDWSTGDKMGL